MVTETDMVMLGSAASRRRDSVVLPAPEGDDMTSSRPRRGMSVMDCSSLDVLDLLAQLVDDGLEVEADRGQRPVGGL